MTSFSSKIFTDHLGNKMVVRGRRYTPPAPTPFLRPSSGQIFKDDVNGFSSTSDIFCMAHTYFPPQHHLKTKNIEACSPLYSFFPWPSPMLYADYIYFLHCHVERRLEELEAVAGDLASLSNQPQESASSNYDYID